jgi:hypothetical protein
MILGDVFEEGGLLLECLCVLLSTPLQAPI